MQKSLLTRSIRCQKGKKGQKVYEKDTKGYEKFSYINNFIGKNIDILLLLLYNTAIKKEMREIIKISFAYANERKNE